MRKGDIVMIIGIVLGLALIAFVLFINSLSIEIADDSDFSENTPFLNRFKNYEWVSLEIPSGEMISVPLADTSTKQTKGLMFVQELEENQGMFFEFNEERPLTFYMKDTYVPLDMIFMNSQLEVVTIHTNTEPLQTETLYPSTEPAQFVLEMPAGWAERNNITIGEKFEF